MPNGISVWEAAASAANAAGAVSSSHRPAPGAATGYAFPEANGVISPVREDVRAAQLTALVKIWDLLIYRVSSTNADLFPQKEWHAILTMETHGKGDTQSDSKAAGRRAKIHGRLVECLERGRKEVR